MQAPYVSSSTGGAKGARSRCAAHPSCHFRLINRTPHAAHLPDCDQCPAIGGLLIVIMGLREQHASGRLWPRRLGSGRILSQLRYSPEPSRRRRHAGNERDLLSR